MAQLFLILLPIYCGYSQLIDSGALVDFIAGERGSQNLFG
jgi:hypothetical protein